MTKPKKFLKQKRVAARPSDLINPGLGEQELRNSQETEDSEPQESERELECQVNLNKQEPAPRD